MAPPVRERNKRYASHRFKPERNPLRCGYWIKRGQYTSGVKTYRVKCRNPGQYRLKALYQKHGIEKIHTIGKLCCRKHIVSTMNMYAIYDKWEIHRLVAPRSATQLKRDIDDGIVPTG